MSKPKIGSKQVAFPFTREGGPSTPEVLGGKGAGLAELARFGVPVPPGFTITTSVARAHRQERRVPFRLAAQIERNMTELERQTNKCFGKASNPLLLSVRSGAAVSMPGMLDTVLNIGLNPSLTNALGRIAGQRFAWDCYRRFLSMFGEVVMKVERVHFDETLANFKRDLGVIEDRELDAFSLEEVCWAYRDCIRLKAGRDVADDPWEQLQLAVEAVLNSWNNLRARTYRRLHRIPEIGTAVNVQSMVFGNMNDNSATGVVFSRNCQNGTPGLWGEFLINAQGEDVVAGVRTPQPIAEMASWNPCLYDELNAIVSDLEARRHEVADVEFTVEDGKLWVLQWRKAKLSAEAAVTVATHGVWDKTLSKEEAIGSVRPEQLHAVKSPTFDPDALKRAEGLRFLARGAAASPGAVTGRAVLTAAKAVEEAKRGMKVILVTKHTSPDDLEGMLASVGIVTAEGGASSHAAVVARDEGKPAVVGCRHVSLIRDGDIISVDGHSGVVVGGAVPLSNLTMKKEVNLFLRWVAQAEAQKPVAKPRLVFELFDQSVSFNDTINDFYLVEFMWQAASKTQLAAEAAQLRERIHRKIAERLATYIVSAVSGELRHGTCDDYSPVYHQFRTLQREFGVRYDRDDRPAQQRETMAMLSKSSHEDHIRFADLATQVFASGYWGRMFGGEKWEAIARAVHDYLTGKLSPTRFADHAFDLQHNSGTIFGKNRMFTGDHGRLTSQLNHKLIAVDVVDLRIGLRCLHAKWSKEVDEFYKRGAKLGLWLKV